MGKKIYSLCQPKPEKKIKNFPIQGTAADGFKTALCQLNRKFQELGLDAHLVLTVHDEILGLAREDEVEELQGIIEDCLINAFKGIVPEMPFELARIIHEKSLKKGRTSAKIL